MLQELSSYISVDSAVVVSGIKKEFGSKIILQNFDLVVGYGEVVCISGESGSGKSSLLRILSGLESYDCGSIFICGKNLNNGDEVWLRRTIGFVTQFPGLFTGKTALQNIVYPLVKTKKIPQLEASTIADDWLARLGLRDCANLYPRHLSGGQSQAIALIRVLLMGYRVLLLDEFYSAMDPNLMKKSISLVQEYKELSFSSIIFTSHDNRAIELLSARIVNINDSSK